MEQIQERDELFNLQAEQAVLGTIILNNEYLNRVSEFLLAEHFYEPAHQKIYEQILHNVEKTNIVANQVTLKQFFNGEESIKAIGGAKYLASLMEQASAIIDIADYAKMIQDLSLKRSLVMVGEDIVSQAYKTHEKVTGQQQIEQAEGKLFGLSGQGSSKTEFRSIANPLKITLDKTIDARQRENSVSGISTGLVDLDKMLSGLQNSDLLILAGRPSMGKTALAINLAVNACKYLNKDVENDADKKAVGFFSLEMSADQLSTRILSMEASINATKFRTGEINDMEWEAIAARSADIANWPFFIDDTPALSISAVRTRTRRMVRKHNLAFIVIDYLQLLKGSSGGRGAESRVQEVSEITQGLKAIAKEFNIPVLALSQLSRAVEQRDDKRPQLSDLRESGSIEQDADVVTFIYRESYYLERQQPPEADIQKFEAWREEMERLRHVSEVIIAKQRNGPVGNAHLFFDAEFTRFGNLDTQHNIPQGE